MGKVLAADVIAALDISLATFCSRMNLRNSKALNHSEFELDEVAEVFHVPPRFLRAAVEGRDSLLSMQQVADLLGVPKWEVVIWRNTELLPVPVVDCGQKIKRWAKSHIMKDADKLLSNVKGY